MSIPGFSVQAMRTTAHVAEQNTQISYAHVHAHDLNPYNEAADSIAKSASSLQIHPDEEDHALAADILRTEPSLLSWLAFAAVASNSPEFPTLHHNKEGTTINITGFAADPDEPNFVIPEYVRKRADRAAEGSVKFTIATLNVLTLNDDKRYRQRKSYSLRTCTHSGHQQSMLSSSITT